MLETKLGALLEKKRFDQALFFFDRALKYEKEQDKVLNNIRVTKLLAAAEKKAAR